MPDVEFAQEQRLTLSTLIKSCDTKLSEPTWYYLCATRNTPHSSQSSATDPDRMCLFRYLYPESRDSLRESIALKENSPYNSDAEQPLITEQEKVSARQFLDGCYDDRVRRLSEARIARLISLGWIERLPQGGYAETSLLRTINLH